ncbi:hypothetical protein B0T21DRAFT_308303 [Apiosordaria backusii]|uniref:UBC core domain-containing protein n=1 Tax=Apiosordaria backusii TaxID=314023 RepID=A0AA40BSD1_9PEZI|nr:hypothetical protein B0T21DRAFT_308303 [Apiosordaria backusii]
MPPLKEKLGLHMQKVQSIFRPSKRRISEDDASNQPPKQHRTMLAKNKTSVAPSPTFQTPPSTSVSGSSKASKTVSRSSGGVKTPHASTAMRKSSRPLPPAPPHSMHHTIAMIIVDIVLLSWGLCKLFELPLRQMGVWRYFQILKLWPSATAFIEHAEPPGSSKENPIDLDEPPSYHSGSASSTQRTLSMSASINSLSIDDDQRQVFDDEAIARLLQEDFQEEHEHAEQSKPNHELFLPLTEEEVQDQIEGLKAKYHTRRCYKCPRSSKMTADSIVQKTQSMLKDGKSFLGRIHPFTKCKICHFEGCMACGKPAKSFPPETSGVYVTDTIRGLWCCTEGRAFVIFSLLCGYERPGSRNTKIPTLPSSGQPEQPEQPVQQTTTAFPKGTGYGGVSHLVNSFKVVKKPKTESEEVYWYLLTLAQALPSVEKDEFESVPGLRVMIHTSPMVRLACEILRSAAIEEMDKRAGIIKAALGFVESLSRNWDAASSVFHEQILFPPEEQLLMATLPSKKPEKSNERVAHETAQSVYTVVEKLAVTCRAFLEGSKTFGVDGDEAVSIASKVCKLQVYLSQHKPKPESLEERPDPCPTASSISRVVTRSKGKELELAVAAAKMAEYHKEHGVMDVADEALLAKFHFQAQANQSTGARMRKLFAQIASLHSDLPDGIYVRYGESRPDMLKVLMFGPKNTPYEHGIFQFDIFCDQDFPKKPPKVQFLTTGGGRARFNPNLYNDGKVCLSLLGTWEGPTWVPDTSTILQVLVSIQSMIFVENPYFNEPGYQNDPNFAQSELYSRDKEYLTVKYAINPWLMALGKASGSQTSLVTLADCNLWGDIVLKHFELKGPAILAKVKEWEKKPRAAIRCTLVTWLESALKRPLAIPNAAAEARQSGAASK